MPDPVTGIIGGGASILSSVIASDASSDATAEASQAAASASDKASMAQLQATRDSIAAQERALAQARSDQAPWVQPSDRALATLQSSIYGEPIQYQQRSLAELGYRPDGAYGNKTTGGKPVVTETGGIPSAYPMQSATARQFSFDPSAMERDPAYQWEKQRGLQDLRTQLLMMGRPTGTVAANSTGRFLGDLNASYDDKFYTRQIAERENYQNQLNNLLNLARGGTAAVTTAGQTAASNTSNALQSQGANLANIYQKAGENQANAALAQGQTQANLYSGLGKLPTQLASSYLMSGGKFNFGGTPDFNNPAYGWG